MGNIPNGKVEKQLAKAVFWKLNDQTVFSNEVVNIDKKENMIKLVDHKSRNDKKNGHLCCCDNNKLRIPNKAENSRIKNKTIT